MGHGVVEARSEPADLWASLKPLTERSMEKAENGTDDKYQRAGEWVIDIVGTFQLQSSFKTYTRESMPPTSVRCPTIVRVVNLRSKRRKDPDRKSLSLI